MVWTLHDINFAVRRARHSGARGAGRAGRAAPGQTPRRIAADPPALALISRAQVEPYESPDMPPDAATLLQQMGLQARHSPLPRSRGDTPPRPLAPTPPTLSSASALRSCRLPAPARSRSRSPPPGDTSASLGACRLPP